MNLGSVRDLSIIILALESIVVGVLLGVLIVQVTKLIRMLRDEVMPILYSTQETLNTMRGTTTFLRSAKIFRMRSMFLRSFA